MKTPPGKSDGEQGMETPAPGETQVIDLLDPDVSAAIETAKDEMEATREAEEAAAAVRRSLPPPLPPEVRASHAPSAPPAAPPAPGLAASSVAPAAAPRSTAFYAVVLLVCLVLGVGGGIVVAMSARKAPAPAAGAPSAQAAPGVITIPVVEVDDNPDSGP